MCGKIVVYFGGVLVWFGGEECVFFGLGGIKV